MAAELIQVKGNTWCITGTQYIPVYKTDEHHAVLLDTGTAPFRGRLERILEEAGITPVGIICSHTHYDHFGNARYLKEKYGIPLVLSIGEAEISRTAAGMKSHLFVFSIGQIRRDPMLKDLPCRADILIEEDQTCVTVAGTEFGILHTPGHAIDHIAIVTPDNVCYCGDAIFTERVLKNTKLPYAFDFGQCMESVDRFLDTDYDKLIFAHRGIEDAPYADLVRKNKAHMEAQMEVVRKLIDHQMSTAELCEVITREMDIHPGRPGKAQELERFLRAYVEYLTDIGAIHMEMRGDTFCYAPS